MYNIKEEIEKFREQIVKAYNCRQFSPGGGFDEILCYELHSQPVNPRMRIKTQNDGYETGLTFRELARKWGISVSFLGKLIADHCRRLEGTHSINMIQQMLHEDIANDKL